MPLFQTEQPDDGGAKRFREFDDFNVPYPARSGFDAGDGKPVNVPTLSLAPGGQFRLGQTEVVSETSDVFASEVFPFWHLCAIAHSNLIKMAPRVWAGMRSILVDEPGKLRKFRRDDERLPLSPGDGNPDLRILCAEDNVLLGEILCRLLSAAGHAVEHVADGLEAWEKMSADFGRFNLLITDHQMPGLSGLVLVERLRQANYGGRIVVYSGLITPAVRAAYEALGVDAIVAKATQLEDLLKAIAALRRA